MGKKKRTTGHGKLNASLKLCVKSGKYVVGWNETVRSIKIGKARCVLVANNTPGLRRSQLEYYCMLGRVPVIHYAGTNSDLGRACGKLFASSTMTVIDAGDSDLLKTIEEKRKRKRARRIGLIKSPPK
mmetsp:Transcript_34049/g.55507  ORF Transcript_34049/g.55507 Transcript_34049/m.55507 type:complete len:128 (-) Transcript_34049:171-554(-)